MISLYYEFIILKWQEWQKYKQDKGQTYKYVWNKEQFEAVDPKEVDYLLGMT